MLGRFPLEVLALVLERCSKSDLLRVRLVCRALRSFIRDRDLISYRVTEDSSDEWRRNIYIGVEDEAEICTNCMIEREEEHVDIPRPCKSLGCVSHWVCRRDDWSPFLFVNKDGTLQVTEVYRHVLENAKTIVLQVLEDPFFATVLQFLFERREYLALERLVLENVTLSKNHYMHRLIGSNLNLFRDPIDCLELGLERFFPSLVKTSIDLVLDGGEERPIVFGNKTKRISIHSPSIGRYISSIKLPQSLELLELFVDGLHIDQLSSLLNTCSNVDNVTVTELEGETFVLPDAVKHLSVGRDLCDFAEVASSKLKFLSSANSGHLVQMVEHPELENLVLTDYTLGDEVASYISRFSRLEQLSVDISCSPLKLHFTDNTQSLVTLKLGITSECFFRSLKRQTLTYFENLKHLHLTLDNRKPLPPRKMLHLIKETVRQCPLLETFALTTVPIPNTKTNIFHHCPDSSVVLLDIPTMRSNEIVQ